MKKDFCLEILAEELPPSEIPLIIDQMKSNLTAFFNRSSIEFEKIDILISSRRITTLIQGLDDMQKDSIEMKKGPAKSLSYDDNGNPSRALMGFLKGNKAEENDIVFENLNGTEYVYIKREIPGKETKILLQNFLPELIQKLNFKKPMKWGNGDYKFVRPVHGFLCLYGDETLNFELFGIKSGNKTSGHRFTGKGIEADNCTDYLTKIKMENVILDFNERVLQVENEINRCEKELIGNVEKDSELMEEVAYLTENPRALIGKFDEEFLKIPDEVLITTLKHHQRTFPVFSDSKLTNFFVSFQDNSQLADENVKTGYEKVIEARLADASFYYHEDIKKPLSDRIDELKNIVFQNKLGSVYEKELRIKEIGFRLIDLLSIDASVKGDFEKIAMLSKCDQVTSMVYEYSELQGYMGKKYAIISNESEEVAEALLEQYSETVPDSLYGSLISLSDKFDTIVGNYLLGNFPTGSKDPYGLRKKVIQILDIIIEKEWPIDIMDLFDFVSGIYAQGICKDYGISKSQFGEIVKNRLESLMTDSGFDIDVIRSCLHKSNVPFDFKVSVEAVQSLKKSEDFESLVNVFERVHNITKKHADTNYDARLFENEIENKLLNEFSETREKMSYHLKHFDYKTAIETITPLKPTINEYFEDVFIMCDREDLKLTRLGFLKNIDNLFMQLADLSMIEILHESESIDE